MRKRATADPKPALPELEFEIDASRGKRPAGVPPFGRGVPDAHSLMAPDSLRVAPGYVRVGDQFARTFVVVAYPREVNPGWYTAILGFPAKKRVSIAMTLEHPSDSVARLSSDRLDLVSSAFGDAKKGKLQDPMQELAMQDADRLLKDIAAGRDKIAMVTIAVTIYAPTYQQLENLSYQFQRECQRVLLVVRSCSLEQDLGYRTTLPLALNTVNRDYPVPCGALASSFPFDAGDIIHPSGSFWGWNRATGNVVIVDVFDTRHLNAAHVVLLGATGSGKSYTGKTWGTQELIRGVELIIVDPGVDAEYERWCKALGGQYVRLSLDAQDIINPLEILVPDRELLKDPEVASQRPVARKVEFVKTMVEAMVKKEGDALSAKERAALDRVAFGVYEARGLVRKKPDGKWDDGWGNIVVYEEGEGVGRRIHLEGRAKPMPTLGDLHAALEADGGEIAREMAEAVRPFVSGSSPLFNGQTNVGLNNQLVVLDIYDAISAGGELAPVVFLVVTEFIRQRLHSVRKRRVVLVDEAHNLFRFESMGVFMQKLYREARKLWAGIWLASQSLSDFTGPVTGARAQTHQQSAAEKAAGVCLQQAPTKAIFKQNSQADVEDVAVYFQLSASEAAHLAGVRRGEGVLICGDGRTIIQVPKIGNAKGGLHRLITTDPEEVALIEAEERSRREATAG